jgi:hypothetical protein
LNITDSYTVNEPLFPVVIALAFYYLSEAIQPAIAVFNTQVFLQSLSKKLHNRLLYYPSAGNRHCFVCDLNADIFVFSDYRPKSLVARRSFWRYFIRDYAPQAIKLIAATPIARVFSIGQWKWGVYLFMDNNRAVEMIWKSGLEISTFVGVCDGCCEGGNYQCVNEMPFFGKILDLMPETGMYIITDHSPYLFDGDGWGEPRSEHRFVLGDSAYETNIIGDRVSGFRNRVYEFIIRKYTINEINNITLPPKTNGQISENCSLF